VAVYSVWAVGVTGPNSDWDIGYYIQAISLTTGNVLWSVNTTALTSQSGPYEMEGASTSVAFNGEFAFASNGGVWLCYNDLTGTLLWTSQQLAYPWGSLNAYAAGAVYVANDTSAELIFGNLAGVYALNWANGDILWNYTANAVPFEQPYNSSPFDNDFNQVSIADGMVYIYNGYHNPLEPIARDWGTYCLNATNGQLIWQLPGDVSVGPIADGYLVGSSLYDGYLYVVGMGQSATTISTPNTAIPLGTEIPIKGTVMDGSPGDQGSIENPTARLDSPSKQGTVPCVNDASMTTLMDYLYMQEPINGIYGNETLTGVPVTLTAIAADGTVTNIGTTTTNGYGGNFATTWTPTKEGVYTIYASYAGDDSYGSSSAYTSVSIGPAPATPAPTVTQAPATDYTPTLTGILAAVVVAIIVSVIALAVVIRKHA
jgi:outer membrane protein assembly factor BamB